MKRTTYMLLCLSFLIAGGCSTVPVQVNEGKIRAKTFSFMGPKGVVTAPATNMITAAHLAIQTEITRNLAARGVARVDNGGDITVGYLLLVASNKATFVVGDYFGYGAQPDGLVEKAEEGAIRFRDDQPRSRIRDPQTFRAGAFVVDVLDSATFTLQYRNFAYRELLSGAPRDLRERRVREVVDEVLRDLHVSPRP